MSKTLNMATPKIVQDYQKYLDIYTNHILLYNSSNIYLYYIKYYITYCNTKHINILHVTYLDICNYVTSLKLRNYSNNYINIRVKTLRSFYSCLHDNKLISSELLDVIRKIKLLKVERRIPNYITLEELKEVIEMGMTFCEFIHPNKLKAILYFLFYTGVRKAEFLNLKRKDVNLEKLFATIRIPTKNKTERIICFPPKLAEIINHYFVLEDEELNAFNTTESQLHYIIHMTKDFVPKDKRGNFSLHTFRHSFAQMLASNEIDIKFAQKLLGHKSLASTEIYYDPDVEKVKQMYHRKIKWK